MATPDTRESHPGDPGAGKFEFKLKSAEHEEGGTGPVRSVQTTMQLMDTLRHFLMRPAMHHLVVKMMCRVSLHQIVPLKTSCYVPNCADLSRACEYSPAKQHATNLPQSFGILLLPSTDFGVCFALPQVIDTCMTWDLPGVACENGQGIHTS